MVGNFRQKNYSAEDGIDGTIGLFRRNSGCSAEQKILGIPFRTIPLRRKMLGILYHGTKLEANARNSVLNQSAEEQKTRNSVPWKKNTSKHLEFCSEPFRGRDNNSEFRSEACLKHVWDENMLSILFAGEGFFVKLIFFHAISFSSELRNRLFRKPRNASDQNSVANPTTTPPPYHAFT
jgi:hypothetical protein